MGDGDTSRKGRWRRTDGTKVGPAAFHSDYIGRPAAACRSSDPLTAQPTCRGGLQAAHRCSMPGPRPDVLTLDPGPRTRTPDPGPRHGPGTPTRPGARDGRPEGRPYMSAWTARQRSAIAMVVSPVTRESVTPALSQPTSAVPLVHPDNPHTEPTGSGNRAPGAAQELQLLVDRGWPVGEEPVRLTCTRDGGRLLLK